MTIGTSTNCSKPENNFCHQTTSHVTIVMPLYFAFVLDSAIVGCFLLLLLTTSFPKKKHEPLVDFLFKTLST